MRLEQVQRLLTGGRGVVKITRTTPTGKEIFFGTYVCQQRTGRVYVDTHDGNGVLELEPNSFDIEIVDLAPFVQELNAQVKLATTA